MDQKTKELKAEVVRTWDLRQLLSQEYKEKNVNSALDRKRIMKAAIGKNATLSSLKEQDLKQIIDYLRNHSAEDLQSPIVAWAYMVELEDGLTKRQAQNLLKLVPNNKEIFPFTLNEGNLLDSNSMAIGFIDNEYYDDLLLIKQTLAAVCNDWNLESDDDLYELSNGKQIKMICDYETLR